MFGQPTPIMELMLITLQQSERSNINGTAATVNAWVMPTLNVRAFFRSLVEVFGMVPSTLLTTMF